MATSLSVSFDLTFRSRGNPPGWLPSFMRPWFTWTRSHRFRETYVLPLSSPPLERSLTFSTPLGAVQVSASVWRHDLGGLSATVEISIAGLGPVFCRSYRLFEDSDDSFSMDVSLSPAPGQTVSGRVSFSLSSERLP